MKKVCIVIVNPHYWVAQYTGTYRLPQPVLQYPVTADGHHSK